MECIVAPGEETYHARRFDPDSRALLAIAYCGRRYDLTNPETMIRPSVRDAVAAVSDGNRSPCPDCLAQLDGEAAVEFKVKDHEDR